MFTTIRLVSRHHITQQYCAILPVKLSNEAIRNSESYKEYYAIASGAEPPKTKASVKKKQSSSDTTMPPPTTKGKRLKTSVKVDKPAKEKQSAKTSKAKGLTVLSEVALIEAEQVKLATKRSLTQTHISHASGSGADEGTGIIPGVLNIPTYEYDDEEISWKSSEDDDDEVKISEHDDDVDDQSDDDDQDDDDDEQTDSDNDGDDFVHPKFSTHDEEDKDEESFDPIVQTSSQVENTNDEDNDVDSHGINVEGDKGANEEDDGNELYGDVNINLEGRDIQMVEAHTTQVIEDTHVTLTSVNPEGQQQSSSVSSCFVLNMLNPSPDTCIDSIFESTPRVDVSVTTTAEPPLLSATTLPPPFTPIISHVQQTPAPSPANVPSSSLRRDDEDKDEEPSAGSNRGSKRRRARKEPESTFTPKEKTSKTSGKSTKPSTPDCAWNKTLPATHGRIQPWISNLAKKADSRTLFNELMDNHVDLSAFVMNRLKVDTLTPKLLVGPTYELMKGSCKSLVELEFFIEEVYKETTDQLDWNNPEGQQYLHDLLKPLSLIPNSRGRRVIPFDHFINNDLEYLHGGVSSRKESARDVYSKRRIVIVTELQIIERHNYKHLDWITVRRDDDKLYKFKEGYFKRLRIQDIKDMLLLMVQGKLTNLTVDERFAFKVSLRMFTRSIYLPQTIWRRSYKDRAAAMIHAIDKQLKTRRIMRSLEKFVGGRLYDGDLRLLQRTI
uniref:Uncharacterized protein n=1 Tax=Tanacetum cinerariifolium TaxID=118510 RepID=A0A6L2JHW9_TANCI|nr:hypothetical protein [Tanacetum cinerariifolium]